MQSLCARWSRGIFWTEVFSRIRVGSPCLYSCCYCMKLYVQLKKIFCPYGDATIAVKGCKIKAYARHLLPFSREGSLSCPIRCDKRPRFLTSHPKNGPTLVALYNKQRVLRILTNPCACCASLKRTKWWRSYYTEAIIKSYMRYLLKFFMQNTRNY